MKRKTFIKSLALVLASIFIFATSANVTAVEAASKEDKTITQPNEQISWEEKISDELWGVIEKAEDNEKIPVYIWYTDIDNKEVEQKVEKKTGLTLMTKYICLYYTM